MCTCIREGGGAGGRVEQGREAVRGESGSISDCTPAVARAHCARPARPPPTPRLRPPRPPTPAQSLPKIGVATVAAAAAAKNGAATSAGREGGAPCISEVQQGARLAAPDSPAPGEAPTHAPLSIGVWSPVTGESGVGVAAGTVFLANGGAVYRIPSRAAAAARDHTALQGEPKGRQRGSSMQVHVGPRHTDQRTRSFCSTGPLRTTGG